MIGRETLLLHLFYSSLFIVLELKTKSSLRNKISIATLSSRYFRTMELIKRERHIVLFIPETFSTYRRDQKI